MYCIAMCEVSDKYFSLDFKDWLDLQEGQGRLFPLRLFAWWEIASLDLHRDSMTTVDHSRPFSPKLRAHQAYFNGRKSKGQNGLSCFVSRKSTRFSFFPLPLCLLPHPILSFRYPPPSSCSSIDKTFIKIHWFGIANLQSNQTAYPPFVPPFPRYITMLLLLTLAIMSCCFTSSLVDANEAEGEAPHRSIALSKSLRLTLPDGSANVTAVDLAAINTIK